MTGTEWDQVEQKLKQQLCPVYLDCDGHIVQLQLDRIAHLKLGITVYVDGWFKGEWCIKDRESGEFPEIGRRFFRLREKRLRSNRDAAKLERALGKKRARNLGAHAKYQDRMPYWQSTRSLRRHVERENAEVRWISRHEYWTRLTRLRQSEGAT